MKKVLFIGDVHGRPEWEKLIMDAFSKYCDIVFLGDYVDSFDIRLVEILHNLKKIIGYKKKRPNKITLLLGNHDYAYIHDRHGIVGFNWHAWQDYKKIFKDNKNLFEIAWGYTNPITHKYTLATHAGLTNTYYNNYIKPLINNPDSKLNQSTNGKADQLQLHEIFNYLKEDEILSKVGSYRGGAGTPGILWADYIELLEDRYEGINQIFGHTAAGTLSIDQFGEDLIAKVDGYGNKQIAHVLLNI